MIVLLVAERVGKKVLREEIVPVSAFFQIATQIMGNNGSLKILQWVKYAI